LGTERAEQRLSQEERKVLYRCRRGTRELDRILSRFFECNYRTLDLKEQAVFRKLLEVEDSFLIDWLCNERPVHERQFEQIVQRIAGTTDG